MQTKLESKVTPKPATQFPLFTHHLPPFDRLQTSKWSFNTETRHLHPLTSSMYKRKIFKFRIYLARSIGFHSRTKTPSFYVQKRENEIGHHYHHVVWQDKWSKKKRIVWNAGGKLIFVVVMLEQKQCSLFFRIAASSHAFTEGWKEEIERIWKVDGASTKQWKWCFLCDLHKQAFQE